MHDAVAIKKHVRTYIGVFVALACLTVVTVRVSTLHLPTSAAITIALVIATIKAGLVVSFFMHLISEKKLIIWVLFLTISFFLVLLLIPYLTDIGMRYPIHLS